MPAHRYVEKNSRAAMLAAKRSASVAPEVNLRECVTCTPPPSANKDAHSGFETQRRPKQGYQPKKTFSYISLFQDLLTEEAHIKDALSRIVVEMMKREWPQNWPTLMPELNTMSQKGPTQTELVLLVLLRVVEDVVTFRLVKLISLRMFRFFLKDY